ncbi:MAG: PLP-dependent aminotransferase family protein [Oscillospiraceae bacterium]|nr:PLP-dependent aminotransferase family protein [Oscillospiraceae bacterium]
MEYRISNRMQGLRPSAIREIFKYAGDPSVISLAAGDPAPESLPVAEMKEILSALLDENPMAALLYSQSEGHPPFRAAVKEYAARVYGAFGPDDELIITSGAQQCMDLTCKTLCNEGDTIICEDPSFIGSLNCFRSYNVNLVGVPMEHDGIDLEKLEAALKSNPHTRFLYLIPNFQNPTGITMSMEKRRAVYELAKMHGVLILEDNPYGDLRFEGENLPAIKSMDTEGIVIYAGTFSKILSTGMRVGYLIAPRELMGKIVVAKQCTDVHTGMLGQLLCHRFLAERDICAHVEANKKIYAEKCRLMLGEMEKGFPAGVTWTKPQGGLFIWCTMPKHVDGADFAMRLVRDHKVCVVPGGAFAVDSKSAAHANCFRMNFSTPSPEKIIKGVGIAGNLLREMI